MVTSGKEVLEASDENRQFLRLNEYSVLLVISRYSFPGRETSGKGSAIISEIITSPGSAQTTENGTRIFCVQLPELSHSLLITNLLIDLFMKGFKNSIL